MRIVVSDTSCLIDLDKVGALLRVLRLPYRFVIPDLVFDREVQTLRSVRPDELPTHGLEIWEVPGPDVAQAQAYANRYRNVSFYDCLSLVVAESQDAAILFTGDGPLRAIGASHGVDVHGTLWALELMVDTGLIEQTEALAVLNVWRDDLDVRIAGPLITACARRIRAK